MAQSRAIAIFGATGDLAQRMLFPSLYFLESEGLLPPDLAIIGCSRSAMTHEAFAPRVREWIRDRSGEHYSDAVWEALGKRLRHAAVDATDAGSFANLRDVLNETGDNLFYLSTSPAFTVQSAAI